MDLAITKDGRLAFAFYFVSRYCEPSAKILKLRIPWQAARWCTQAKIDWSEWAGCSIK